MTMPLQRLTFQLRQRASTKLGLAVRLVNPRHIFVLLDLTLFPHSHVSQRNSLSNYDVRGPRQLRIKIGFSR